MRRNRDLQPMWAITLVALACIVQVHSRSSTPTHICDLQIKNESVNLSCTPQGNLAARECDLVVYREKSLDGKPARFGVPALLFPELTVKDCHRKATHPSTKLNLTETHWNVTVRPMLMFRGNSACNVVFNTFSIMGAEQPAVDDRKNHRTLGRVIPCQENKTTVVAFGGGLSATIKDGAMANNFATHVVAVLAKSSLTLRDSRITSNNVSGAVFAYYGSELFLDKCTFARNLGPKDRAAVAAISAQVNITKCVFEENSAGNTGAALHLTACNATVLDSRFGNNAAPAGAGVIAQDLSRVLIRNCTFSENQARNVNPVTKLDNNYFELGVGGALLLDRSAVHITNCTLSKNTAVMDGGAIRMQLSKLQHTDPSAERLRITNSTLVDNRAYRHGGVIFVGTNENITDPKRDPKQPGWQPVLFIKDSVLKGNEAQANGGAIMLQPGADVAIVDTNITNNHAWTSGGGLATEMGKGEGGHNDARTHVVLDNATFTANSGSGKDLFVGPNFNVTFANSTSITEHSHGVSWHKRNCTVGEYKLPSSGFCTLCAPYTWQPDNEGNVTGKECPPRPSFTHAPGGAILIPHSFYWHGESGGKNPTITNCRGCHSEQSGQFKLANITRCPNPAACQHNEAVIAYAHPHNVTTSADYKYSWTEYGNTLCADEKGYSGIMCGVCLPGYGATTPFVCHECLQSGSKSPSVGRAKISILYIFYWVVLTGWFLFSAWSAILSKAGQQLQTPGTAPGSGNSPVKGSPTVVHVDSLAEQQQQGKDKDISSSNCKDQDNNWDPAAGLPAWPGRAQGLQPAQSCLPSPETLERQYREAKLMDVTKAVMIYAQWGLLILSLPIIWLPRQLNKEIWQSKRDDALRARFEKAEQVPIRGHTSRAPRTPTELFMGVILGRSASLDCLMQAWNNWRGDTAKDISSAVLFKAAANLIIIPCILFLSVATLQLLWWYVRGWLVRLLLRHGGAMWGVAAGSTMAPGQPAQQPAALQEVRTSSTNGEHTGVANSTAPSSPGVKAPMVATWEGKSLGTYMFEHLVATLLVLVFYFYSTFARNALGLLFCVNIGASSRWVLDVRLQCPLKPAAAPQHVGALLLGIPALMFCILWPIIIAVVLWHAAHKGKLYGTQVSGATSKKDRLRAMLAFRYADYDVDYAGFAAESMSDWIKHGINGVTLGKLQHALARNMVLAWDSVLDFVRFMLALISLCVALHEIHQLALVLLVLSIYMVLVLVVRPWRSPAVQLLQVMGLLVLLLSCLGIMVCAVREADTNYHTDSQGKKGHRASYREGIAWSVVVLNIVYIAGVGALLLLCVYKQLKLVTPTVIKMVRKYTSRSGAQQRAVA